MTGAGRSRSGLGPALAIVTLAVLLVEGLGYAAYRLQRPALEWDADQRLSYLAGKKADRIDAWLRERLGDAEVTARDPLLLDQLGRLGPKAGPGPRLGRQLVQRLAVMQQAYGYSAIHLLGPDGGTLAATGDQPLRPWEARAVPETGDRARIVWQLLDQPGQGPQLVMACLVQLQAGDSRRALGTLVFRLDPEPQLANSVGGWPASSPSGETLVLARQGDQALFLNQTRLPGPPLGRMSMARTDRVGVQALLSRDGVKWGLDYRDVPTVAVARRIKGLDWVLMVKVDREEYLKPMRRLVWTYSGLGVAFLGFAAAFLAGWYDREKARERAERGRLEAERLSLGRQLGLLSNYSNDIVLLLDASGQVLEANDRAVAGYQYSLEDLRQLKVQDLRAPEARREFPDQFEQVKHQSAIRFKTLHQRRDGTVFPVEVSSLAFELAGQRYVRSLIRDITEERAYERRIQTLNDDLERRVLERTAQLETAFREMEAFSYSVSHDLRGPLRGIDGFGHVLLEEYGERLDPQGRHYLERIRAGAQRMGLIMDDLLDLSRLSRHDLNRTPVDLGAQAREILAGLAGQEPGPRPVAVAIQEDLRVQADPRLMHMVLTQLLSNAWKFTGNLPEARIEFGRAAPGRAAGTTATFFVRDNGAGFDMQFAGKLFTAFQRLHDPSEFPGTGVGLAIVQRILNRHGGHVWAEAAVGQGATFFFTLPN